MQQFTSVHSWTPDFVYKWVAGLHPLAKQHGDVLLQNSVAGSRLLRLTWPDLEELGVQGMFDQEALLSAIAILRDVDIGNKNFLVYPVAGQALRVAREAYAQITQLKLERESVELKQALFMSCISCGNLTRDMLLHIERYQVSFAGNPRIAHELLCSLYSITHAAQQVKDNLRSMGVRMPDIPQELPHNTRQNNFTPCLQASLQSLIDNARLIMRKAEVTERGCPSFERITLHPDSSDTGWGFSFRETSNGIYIIKRILVNTPADKSGRIKSGDEVLEINDQNIVGWKIRNVVELIRTQPSGLVMVVRHYPDRQEAAAQQAQQEEGVDTPRKPPRPLDSVLRERCRSNKELDQHFKTVHNPKRLSQIYGDFNSLDELNCLTLPERGGKRSNNNHRRNNSNPLDQFNSVNMDWLDSLKPRTPSYGAGQSSKPQILNYGHSPIKYGTSPHIRSSALSLECNKTAMSGSVSRENMDVNLADICDKKLGDKTLIQSEGSIYTAPSTISNSPSMMTDGSIGSTRTLPRHHRHGGNSEMGEIKNLPVDKESTFTACVIGGVVHKIPVQATTDIYMNGYATIKNRKRQNKRSSWSVSNDKAATLPKNIRFSLADLEDGTLKKKKNKKPSRSTSSILGDTNVSCKSLQPNSCEGWLLKLGGSGLTPKNWRKRWFVLKGFCLYYFKSDQDEQALGVITMPSFNIAAAHEVRKKYAFKAYHKNTRTYYFLAETEEERQRWMEKMLLATIMYDEADSGYGHSPVGNETVEQSLLSPCDSMQSIGSTTVV